MALYDDFIVDEALIGEAPCQFCGESYPLVLLWEHQLVCEHEDFAEQFVDNSGLVGNPVLPEKADKVQLTEEIKSAPKEPQIVKDVKQTQNSPMKQTQNSSMKQEQSLKGDLKKELLQTFEQFQIEKSGKDDERKITSLKKLQTKRIDELNEERGEKLMVYGTDTDLDKNFENESETYKMPNNPLLQDTNEREDVEDINNLSDDDCKESLEEFWKRARDQLKRRRKINA